MKMAYIDGRNDITVSQPVLLVRIFHCGVHAVTCNGHVYRDQQQILSTLYVFAVMTMPNNFTKMNVTCSFVNMLFLKRT